MPPPSARQDGPPSPPPMDPIRLGKHLVEEHDLFTDEWVDSHDADDLRWFHAHEHANHNADHEHEGMP